MKSRRTLLLVAACVIGAIAALGLYSYVRSAGDSAADGNNAVEVWVVKTAIPKGTSGQDAIDQGLIGLDNVAQKLRPANAITNPETELAGLVAASNLPVSQTIVQGSFDSVRVVNAGVTERLKDGNLATVTFSVDSAKGVGHLIEPDDYVNILVERKWVTRFFEEEPAIPVTPDAFAELQTNLSEEGGIRPILNDVYETDARYVYQKARVLAVGTELAPQAGDNPNSEDSNEPAQERGLITLAVPPEAVQVILNVGRENLYLSLVSDDYTPKPLLPLDPTTQVLPGETGSRLTPYVTADGEVITFSDEQPLIGTTPSPGTEEVADPNNTANAGVEAAGDSEPAGP